MKKVGIVIFISFLSIAVRGQVGIGTTNPDASSILEISSTTKGVLIPRMTKTQMAAISPRVEGLMVYCSDCDIKSLYVYDGSNYVSLTSGGETVASLDSKFRSSLFYTSLYAYVYLSMQNKPNETLKKNIQLKEAKN